MALAIDSSTPSAPTSVAPSAASSTTGSFTPPAGSVIFVFISLAGSSGSPQSATISDNIVGGHLSWKRYANNINVVDNTVSGGMTGSTEVWYAPSPNSQSMTVTATYDQLNNAADGLSGGMIMPVVFTGAATTQSGNYSIRNDSSFESSGMSQTLTTSVDNSWVFGAIHNFVSSTAPTIPAGQTDVIDGANTLKTDSGVSTFMTFWVQAQTSTTPTAGTVVTINDTAPAGFEGHITLVEVLPAPVAPTVTTQAVTNIAASTATGNGNVTSDGGGTITERGIVWNTTGSPTTADNKVTAGGTTGSYSASLTSLTASSVIHVRAYATNSAGTSYGNEVTFNTYQISSSGNMVIGWLHR